MPARELLPEARAFAAVIAAKSRRALVLAKEALNGIEPRDVDHGYRFEQGFTLEMYLHEDSQKARDAFVKDRQAREVLKPVALNLQFTPEQQRFRAEVRAWMGAHVPKVPLQTLESEAGFAQHRQWERTLARGNWGMITWPREFGGRGANLIDWLIFEEEYYRAAAPLRVNQNGIFLLGPTLMEFGTPAQKARYLPQMAAGEEIWAQAWSEPQSGSDLAALRATAVRDGDSYVLQGPQDLVLARRVRGLGLRHLPHRSDRRTPSRPELHSRAAAAPGRAGPRHPPDPRRAWLRRDLLRGGARTASTIVWARRARAGRSPWRRRVSSAA